MRTQTDLPAAETSPPPATHRSIELDALLKLAHELAKTGELESASDLPVKLDAVLTTLTQAMPQADLAWLLLHDSTSDSLRVLATAGYNAELMRQVVLKNGESFSGKVFRDGQPRLLETRQAVAEAMGDMAPRNRELFARLTGGRIPSSAIAVPLAVGDRRLGALVMESLDKPSGFAIQDQPFVQAAADLIALAIDRFQLHDEAQALRTTEKATQIRSDILSAISHELRTPLASIKGYSTALLLDEVEWDETRRHEFLQLIDEECDKLEEIVRDFLDAARIDAGRLEIEWQPVMLPRLAQIAVDDIARRTAVHRFVLDFPDFPIVDADPVRIGQVLHNLVDNAVKYSPQGGLIVVRGMVKDDEVVVSVSDQGIGIAPQDLNQLFDRFFRVKAPTGHHVPGSGLGLPISQSIIETHGGRIWAESQLRQGTTLYFTLPRTGLSAGMGDEGE
jgi:signal transduction histidine kinase